MTHKVSVASALLAMGLVSVAGSVLAADNAPVTPPPPAVALPPAPAASAAPGPAAAAKPPAVPDINLPANPPVSPDSIATLKMFEDQGADINYLGRKFGMDGWLVSKGNAIQVLYTTADGQGTVVGLLYGPDGNIVTGSQLMVAKQIGLNLQHTTPALNNIGENGAPGAGAAGAMPPLPSANVATPAEVAASVGAAARPATQMQPVVPAAPPAPAQAAPAAGPANPGSPSERMWGALGKSVYITFGSPSAPPLYVFMDPTCHYCHDYFETLMNSYVPQGQVQLRVIPVGILSAKSKQEAGAVLTSVDPAAAWRSVETGDTSSLPGTASEDKMQQVNNNQGLMEQWDFRGTPGSVYRGKDGKVKVVYGLPQNIADVVGDVGPSDH